MSLLLPRGISVEVAVSAWSVLLGMGSSAECAIARSYCNDLHIRLALSKLEYTLTYLLPQHRGCIEIAADSDIRLYLSVQGVQT